MCCHTNNYRWCLGRAASWSEQRAFYRCSSLGQCRNGRLRNASHWTVRHQKLGSQKITTQASWWLSICTPVSDRNVQGNTFLVRHLFFSHTLKSVSLDFMLPSLLLSIPSSPPPDPCPPPPPPPHPRGGTNQSHVREKKSYDTETAHMICDTMVHKMSEPHHVCSSVVI